MSAATPHQRGPAGDRDVVVAAPAISGNRISVSLRPGRVAARYFREREIRVEYRDVDLDGVDPAVAVVPALGVVIPVALACGGSVHVPEVDAVFADGAAGIAKTLQAMYPHFPQQRFQLTGARRPAASASDPDRAAMLYSGGVDSVTTLLRHRPAVDCVVTVWGADVELGNAGLWDRLSAIVAAAPVRPGTRHVVARSNLREALDELRLNRDFDRGFASTNWWGAVQHGLALTSLVAPVAVRLGLGRVLVSSTHSAGFRVPWGSNPELDNLVRWSGGRVEHDGFELERQDKLAHVVAPWLARGDKLALAVCYQLDRDGTGVNCGRCEKCLRTISGLLAAHVDPHDAGLPFDAGSLTSWRSRLERGEAHFGQNELFMWQGIQQALRGGDKLFEVHGSAAYLSWLKDFDVASLATGPAAPAAAVGDLPAWRYLAVRQARRVPYPVRRRLRRWITRTG
ncbi:hypothetical protein [Couchioplanes azureus]|uniref:hypothetical protein n=1 Tax=Couchioplanes caeruleus TaxID=56438 RepID=UPI001670F2A9|nr:hypothetical protein [Couchioplanes caeruleus]GGQ40451.1 hypothetical protein GCM10010166_04430 [Couchioplanes caeruleus subsp. azureus]